MNKEVDTLDFSILDSIASVPGHIYCKNLNGEYIWCNKELLDTFAVKSMTEILGKTDFDLFDHVTAVKQKETDQRIMKSGKAEILEEEGSFNSNSEIRATLSYKAPLRDKKGKIIGIIGNCINITKEYYERRRFQDEAYKNLVALRNILANVPSNIYWKNKEGVLLGCNLQHEQLGPWSAKQSEDLIGKTLFDITQNKDLAQRAHDQEIKIIESGKAEVFEEVHVLSDKKHYFLSNKGPLIDPNTNEIIGTIGTSIDITDRKELQEELKEKVKELQAAMESQERFLNHASHEIRTPVSGMTLLASTLSDCWDTLTEEQKRKTAKDLGGCGDRLISLLSNLLDMSKFRHGKMVFDFKYHNMKTIIFDVMQEFMPITRPIDLNVKSNVDTFICCDDWRIKQVIRNVIGNAVKYGSKGKPITITLTNFKKDKLKYLQIAIQDEGVGIPEKELSAIFDIFSESTRTRSKAGGVGLGLALCKEIAVTHGGDMWAENNKSGVGSTFYITIPFEEENNKVYTYALSTRNSL
jgi:PAS domain S-box-containing protein